ncbi:MAG: ATPase domain-containing protein [Thermoplasmata archaeon]
MNATRITTGTPGLDRLLGGGLLPGGVYSIIGPPGTGKSILGVQFLIEGIKRGENAFLVSVDEPPCEVRENMQKMFGDNFDKIFVLDGTLEMKHYEITPLRDVTIVRRAEQFRSVFPEIPNSIDVRNPDLTVSSLQEMIKVEAREKKISRLVIDSVTAIKLFMMPTSERNQFVQSFMRFLCDLGISTLITIHENDASDPEASKIEQMMSRGVIRLHRWYQPNGFKLGISVDKFRGSEHDETINRAKITPIGLQVMERPRSGGE